MWFYSADANLNPGKPSAEIDLYEIFGNPNQWHTSIHGSRVPKSAVQTVDTASWHTYGMNWQNDLLQFFEDGKMCIRLAVAGILFQRLAHGRSREFRDGRAMVPSVGTFGQHHSYADAHAD